MSAYLVGNSLQSSLRRCSGSVPFRHKSYFLHKMREMKALNKIVEPTGLEAEEHERPNYVTVTAPPDVGSASGVPKEHINERIARIYLTPKNSMQSGTDNVDHWELEFETRDRWENPLMGWSSSGDPLSNMKLQFTDKEDAIRYAEKIGYSYYIEPERKGMPKVKSYGFNFSWNKRSRVSTK